MPPTIRLATAADHASVLDMASRAWPPIFAAVNDALGPELARRLHGRDWRPHHAAEVAAILTEDGTTTWVAELDNVVVGFASARVVDPTRKIGDIRIVGVDPATQRGGVGSALTRQAESWLRDQGMAVAFVGTGGDPGHAPARRLYEELGYHPYPAV